MKRVLITDDVHTLLIEGLEALGYFCDFQPEITLDETRAKIQHYDGVVINSKIKAGRDFISEGSKLEFIARLGSGLDIIDLEAAKQHNVHVISAPEGNRNAVAEHALGMLLSLLNHLNRADEQVRKQIWERELNRGVELAGKKVGIVGFGNTGSQFAKKLQGLDVEVWAHDKYKQGFAESYDYVREVSCDALFDCDIISFHLPLTEETFHFCDETFIDNCKSGVILINTSRGKVIKLKDLVSRIDSGQVGGLCMDVFENEQPRTFTKTEQKWYNRLFSFENAIFSPHIAGWTIESKIKIAQTLLDKIKREL